MKRRNFIKALFGIVAAPAIIEKAIEVEASGPFIPLEDCIFGNLDKPYDGSGACLIGREAGYMTDEEFTRLKKQCDLFLPRNV